MTRSNLDFWRVLGLAVFLGVGACSADDAADPPRRTDPSQTVSGASGASAESTAGSPGAASPGLAMGAAPMSAADSCAAISAQAENRRAPADIDNSGSMDEEIALARFEVLFGCETQLAPGWGRASAFVSRVQEC
jgi:hypothetical protein